MKTLMVLFLILAFVLPLGSGNTAGPKLKEFKHGIEYRKEKSTFVNFVWSAKIQGTEKEQKILLEVWLLNAKKETLYNFKEILLLKAKKVQDYKSHQLIPLSIASQLQKVTAKVGVMKGKKY